MTQTNGHNSGSRDGLDGTGPESFPYIEGYEIVDLVGRGGMGAVYEAYQQSTGRRVAVKLMLERAAATESSRRRFEREVELIARLQHPNIVSILDSGLHKGRYFFVMDFVEGRPLDEAFSPGKCEPKPALAAVAKIARAVDYAHQRGVMHRDLKPSNVSVDQRSEPRLLDFGLAKAFDPNSMVHFRDSISEPGQVIGTLGYMSPEQARGDVQRVSVRSDVYALGAIAYELVTGSLPCPIDGAMALVFQRIEARDPTRPSELVRGLGADADAVLLKALEKDPAKRYASAAELADDLERFVSGRPVLARRTGPILRAARWCRRNPALAGVVALVALVGIIAGASWWATTSAERAAARSEALRAKAQAILATTMVSIHPDETMGRPIPIVAAEKIESQLEAEPLEPMDEANLREQVAKMCQDYSDYGRAERNARRVLELRRGFLSEPHADIARAMHNLGAVLFHQGRYAEAEELYRPALEMRRKLYGKVDHAELADTMNHLAATLTRLRRLEEAGPLQENVLAMRRRLFPEDHKDVAAAVNNLGTYYLESQQPDRAVKLYADAVERFVAKIGTKEHRFVAKGLRNVARCLLEMERYDEVDGPLADAQEINARVLGEDDAEVAITLLDRARLRERTGRLDEAETMARRALTILVDHKKREPDHFDVALGKLVLGRVLMRRGKTSEALEIIEALHQVRKASPTSMPTDLAEIESVLGALYVSSGRAADGEAMLRKALDALMKRRGASSWRTRDCAERLASVLAEKGDEAGAAAVLAQVSR